MLFVDFFQFNLGWVKTEKTQPNGRFMSGCISFNRTYYCLCYGKSVTAPKLLEETNLAYLPKIPRR